MRILLLSDLLDNWSIHNRCKTISRLIPEYSFEIRAGEEKEKDIRQIVSNFDIIHINFTCGLVEYSSLIFETPYKYIITIANERSLYEGYGIPNKDAFLEMIRKGAYATSVSKKVASKLNIEWIPNGVDLDLFKEGKKIKVGFVGTLSEVKNYRILEKVCYELNLDLIAKIYSLKNDPQENMVNFYKSIDVLVHPSKSEGCSNVILEALAMNVPIITTATGIWDEFIGYVDFIEPYYDSIKEALRRFKSRNLIESKFDWKIIVPKYKRIYDLVYSCILKSS